MRILIYGAGVIGSLYASLFSKAGIDTTVYARGRRLESLRQNGLRYEKNGKIQTANVRVLDALAKDDIYDFIFVPVRENQLHEALTQLRDNQSPYIVTMVNSLEDYCLLQHRWDTIIRTGLLLFMRVQSSTYILLLRQKARCPPCSSD